MQRPEGRSHQPRDAWSPRSWKRREGPSLEPVEGAAPGHLDPNDFGVFPGHQLASGWTPSLLPREDGKSGVPFSCSQPLRVGIADVGGHLAPAPLGDGWVHSLNPRHRPRGLAGGRVGGRPSLPPPPPVCGRTMGTCGLPCGRPFDLWLTLGDGEEEKNFKNGKKP